MFSRLGKKMDGYFYSLQEWFYSTGLYKIRMYLGIKKYIKERKIESDKHFDRMMIQAGWKQLHMRHFNKLIELYYKDNKTKKMSLKMEAKKLWHKADNRYQED